MTRRDLLILASAAHGLARGFSAADLQNVSYPLDGISGSITPTELFFVRDHFPEAELSLSSWRLKFEGRVASSLELSFADILESPTQKIEAVLECAGNPAIGSAVSNAEWEGVPLATLLARAQVEADARAVMLEGADSGRLNVDVPELPYCQVVPLSKCLRPESLLAFKLNDRFLPRKSGFPVRALFPGWYGMNSVKWLRRIVVLGSSDQAVNFQLSGMNKLYNRVIETKSGHTEVDRVTELQVRSVISWPMDKARLPLSRYLVRGFAWTGAGVIKEVRMTADGGRTWFPAHIESSPKPYAWVRWKYQWSPEPGDYLLMSRAFDDAGREQPLTRNPSRKDGYELNFCAPVRCSVR